MVPNVLGIRRCAGTIMTRSSWVTSVGRVSQAAVLWLDSTLVGTEQALNTTEGTHRSA